MAPSVIQRNCLGRTCLKWSSDGSLSEHDQNELMRRLCSADPEMAKSGACDLRQDADLSKTHKR